MVHILFDAHQLGLHQTGNETWARNTISRLEHHLPARSTTYAVTPAGVDVLRGLTDAPYRLVSGNSARRLGMQLPRLLRTLKADVVFSQYTMPATPVPAVVLVHDISFEQGAAAEWLDRRTRLQYRASFRSSARFANRLLTVSEFTRQAILHTGRVDPGRISVASNAVDPVLAALLRGGTPRRRGGTVLAVGNVLPRKNLHPLARAVRALADDGADVRLRIVGQIPAAGRRVATGIAAILADRVSFTGYVDARQLAGEYLSADVLAFPSLHEGFGIPALEAMSAGLPVIVSDQAALPEVVGEAGLVVPASDVGRWRLALDRVLDGRSGLSAALAAGGRHRLAAYDWDTSAAATAAALLAAARR
jgi:glycosyltransferase involved in cell wall biosynthesis